MFRKEEFFLTRMITDLNKINIFWLSFLFLLFCVTISILSVLHWNFLGAEANVVVLSNVDDFYFFLNDSPPHEPPLQASTKPEI